MPLSNEYIKAGSITERHLEPSLRRRIKNSSLSNSLITSTSPASDISEIIYTGSSENDTEKEIFIEGTDDRFQTSIKNFYMFDCNIIIAEIGLSPYYFSSYINFNIQAGFFHNEDDTISDVTQKIKVTNKDVNLNVADISGAEVYFKKDGSGIGLFVKGVNTMNLKIKAVCKINVMEY